MDQDTANFLHNLVDLHLHLGASSTPHFLWELAHDQGIRLSEKDYFSFIDSITIREKTTYEKYLKFFDLTERIQSSTFAIEGESRSSVACVSQRNVTTIEIRFNPMLRNKAASRIWIKLYFPLLWESKACLEYPRHGGASSYDGPEISERKKCDYR